ncbi:dihydrofolate reductase family protein [Pedobacter sp. PF22-3]|uniref:dihydrofolate reductase family protein n=1 Tax=Pedobacter sp. PF22-3 TaxID=2994467 RepID=UPI00224847B1|nr:dihydrofolate reductase family protein [Pedobacter sp. PF22-3]MCX2493985.1 dihydrofolate reductase family protein [Pedobacter sp. PF22-3]
MRKIRIMEHISLDGVMQHENSEDFAHGGWTTPYRSLEGLAAVLEAQGTNIDLLLGRKTYDDWAQYWPKAGDNPMANSLNNGKKYVATHRPESLEWGPVEDLGTDIVTRMRDLKSTEGPDLIVYGSSTLIAVLLEEGLVDEVVLMVYPVLLGTGKRFFAEPANACQLAFVSTKTTPTGVLLNTYRYVGKLES